MEMDLFSGIRKEVCDRLGGSSPARDTGVCYAVLRTWRARSAMYRSVFWPKRRWAGSYLICRLIGRSPGRVTQPTRPKFELFKLHLQLNTQAPGRARIASPARTERIPGGSDHTRDHPERGG